METVNKLETQTSIESNNNNDTNAEVTKLLNNDTLNNINNESNSDTKTPTNCIATTNGGGNKDTSFMFFSSSSKLTYKPINGKIRKPGANYVFKQENIKSYTDTHGIVYNINDHVYMDINKPNQPFAIACVLDFKLTKRDNVVIEVRWYYRPNEIPDGVYMPLMQDRVTENHISSELIEPIIKGRELFASESRDIYPATFIKGKCRVFHFEDILEAKNFKPFADTFFCILTYNPEARRLANIQGEIRVGASHQVKLPPCQTYRNDKELTDLCNSWEHCMWKCKKIKDSSLYTYLQAARSVAALAGICDRGSMDDMYEAAQCDTTSLHAMTVLHDTGYDTEKALKVLVKTNQTSKMFEKKWSEEDQKKFVKGLSQFGKNFFRIRKELLPHKETSQIIEFYYLWKKTSSAQQNRFRRRIRPSSTKKLTQTKKNLGQTAINSEINGQTNSQNNNNTNNSNNNPNNEQFSGGSDIDSDNDSDESSDQKQQSTSNQQKGCANCFTNLSTDLQNGGRDNQLLCYDCRMFYKKYGELPKIGGNNSTASSSSTTSTSSDKTNKLECNLLKRITDEDEFNLSCDKECADTISKNDKTLTPTSSSDHQNSNSTNNNNNSNNNKSSPTRSVCSAISDQENGSSIQNNYNKSSVTPVSSVQNESNYDDSNCSSPADLSMVDSTTNDDLYQAPKQIDFIFDKPLENIKPDSNARFKRVWDRGFNSCCRTDVHFIYLPNSKYLRTLNDKKLQKERTANQNNNANNNNNPANTNTLFVEQQQQHHPQQQQQQHQQMNNLPSSHMFPFPPAGIPGLPPNFNFKDMLNNPEEFQAHLMSKLLMGPGANNQGQFNLFNNNNNNNSNMNMNNFHQAAAPFNKPRLPQNFHPDNSLSQQQQHQQHQQLLQMEQFLKMNGNPNFPMPSFNNNQNNNNNMLMNNNFNEKNIHNHQNTHHNNHQQQQQQLQHQSNQIPKYPFEFDSNPALRQLRDIADKSNLIHSFANLNNNPMFNYFQQ